MLNLFSSTSVHCTTTYNFRLFSYKQKLNIKHAKKTILFNLGWKDNKTWVNSNEIILKIFISNLISYLDWMMDVWIWYTNKMFNSFYRFTNLNKSVWYIQFEHSKFIVMLCCVAYFNISFHFLFVHSLSYTTPCSVLDQVIIRIIFLTNSL